MYRNASMQQLLPEDLQQLFEKNMTQSIEEALCVLYVALTRAIYGLYMVVTPSAGNERNLPKSSAGLLRAALTDGQRLAGDCVAYCSGDPHWHEKLAPVPVVAATSTIHAADRPITLAPMPADLRHEFVSPSQLEGGARVRRTCLGSGQFDRQGPRYAHACTVRTGQVAG